MIYVQETLLKKGVLDRQWESKAFKQKRKVRPHLGFRKVFLEWVEKGRD